MRSLEKVVTFVHDACCVREESERRGKINVLGTSKKPVTKHVEVLNGSSRAVKVAPNFMPVMTDRSMETGLSHRSNFNDNQSSRGCLQID